MSIPVVLFLVALILALVALLGEDRVRRGVLAVAVVCLAVGLLWGHIG